METVTGSNHDYERTLWVYITVGAECGSLQMFQAAHISKNSNRCLQNTFLGIGNIFEKPSKEMKLFKPALQNLHMRIFFFHRQHLPTSFFVSSPDRRVSMLQQKHSSTHSVHASRQQRSNQGDNLQYWEPFRCKIQHMLTELSSNGHCQPAGSAMKRAR